MVVDLGIFLKFWVSGSQNCQNRTSDHSDSPTTLHTWYFSIKNWQVVPKGYPNIVSIRILGGLVKNYHFWWFSFSIWQKSQSNGIYSLSSAPYTQKLTPTQNRPIQTPPSPDFLCLNITKYNYHAKNRVLSTPIFLNTGQSVFSSPISRSAAWISQNSRFCPNFEGFWVITRKIHNIFWFKKIFSESSQWAASNEPCFV